MNEWQKNFFIKNWSVAFWKRNLNEALLHFEGPRDVLLVGFDSQYGNNRSKNWRPWGAEFAQEREMSFLGFSTVSPDWYLSDWFDKQVAQLVDDGFFERFSRVVFAGHSMGAHGALRFSSAVRGAYVAAFSPQVTLQPDRAGFDTRFETAQRLLWRDAATDISTYKFDPERTWVIYDPYTPEDRRHAERVEVAGVRLLRTYHSGHGSMAYLRKIGVADDVLDGICFDNFSPESFYSLLRYRRYVPWFHNALSSYYKARGREAMLAKLDAAVHRLRNEAAESRFEPTAKAVP